MILAFDTSNYTTSVCLVDNGVVINEWRTLVKVKLGEQGIRQSDAFFQHTQVLQQWVDEHLAPIAPSLHCVCVSTRPRPIDGSYMPVFNAGKLVGNTIAHSLGIPIIETTHQEGHLFAALATVSGAFKDREPLLFFHLSGGTTELHLVAWDQDGANMTLIAETADISIGQLIDRIGVSAGLSFPCGAEMDRIAQDGDVKENLPSFKVKPQFNLSGYENYFKLLLSKYPDHPEWVFNILFKGIHIWLSKTIEEAVKETGIRRVLLAGGVAASQNLSKYFASWQAKTGIECQISDPRYASDNAFGVALIGEENTRRK